MIMNMTPSEDHLKETTETLLETPSGDMVKIETETIKFSGLEYQIYESPPICVNIFVAMQHILMSLASALSTAFIISDTLCVAFDDPLRTKMFCSTLFMCGICSMLQTTFGVRLPVYQGPSSSFIVPLLALKRDVRWSCPDTIKSQDMLGNFTSPSTPQIMSNTTESLTHIYSVDERLQQLSGSLMIASLIEVIIGGTGLVGPLLKYIGPITVAPTITLIGLSLVKIPIIYSRPQWVMAFFGALLVLIFSLYLYRVKIPMPRLNCRTANNDEKLKPRFRFALFQILPILLSIIILWTVAAILTLTDVLSTDPKSLEFKARTDSKLNIVSMTPWFSIPYPGQFGIPKISTAVIVGFSAATISSLIESVGDYFAAAKSCQVPAPPDHAITRGILIEGIGSILSGAVGVGHATTSYSGNIAAITLSKTASRSVMIATGLLLVGIAVIGKVGACLALIPDPALGGVLVILLGLLVSLGMSNLRYVDLNSNRNLIIIGTSVVVGLMIPEWIDSYPDFISTGSLDADQVLKVALGTPMFLGGVVALILDNTVRGTLEERGMLAWRDSHSGSSNENKQQNSQLGVEEVYDVPYVQTLYKLWPCLDKLPFLPRNKTNIRDDMDDEQIVNKFDGHDSSV